MRVDIHSHLLPGIDDGSPDVATSVRYIKALLELGITKFHCTPHILAEYYANTHETINVALTVLKQGLKEANVEVVVTPPPRRNIWLMIRLGLQTRFCVCLISIF